jgi:hypothetical protein
VYDLPQSAEDIFFVGISRRAGNASEARENARENAFTQVVKFYGEYIQSSESGKAAFTGNLDNIETYMEHESEITTFAQTVVTQVSADKYYTEVYRGENNQEEFIVYVLCQIPRQRAERDIQNFAKNTSERYSNLLARQNTLHAALSAYAEIYNALRQNPFLKKFIRAEGSDYFVAVFDGHANKTDILFPQIFPRPGTVQKKRLLGNIGNDHGLAGLNYLAGDALSQLIFSFFHLAGRKAVSRFDKNFPLGAVQNRYRAPHHSEFFGDGLQNWFDYLFNIHTFIEDLTYLKEKR